MELLIIIAAIAFFFGSLWGGFVIHVLREKI